MEQIKLHIRGGLPGQDRLKLILPTLFSYFQIITVDSRIKLLTKCGLFPIKGEDSSEVTFYFNPEKANPLKPGKNILPFKPLGATDLMMVTGDENDQEEEVAPLEEGVPLSPFLAQMEANTQALPSPA